MRKRAHNRGYRLIYVILAAACCSYSLLQSLVAPVLALLARDLHTDQNTVTWVLTAYLLSASVLTPILGRVGDMIGKERVFVAVLISVAIGSVVAALATSIGVMIIGRVIQGIGGAVVPLAFGIVRDEFPPDKVASGVGIIAGFLAVGSGLGLVLAGPIVNLLTFHWLFWLPTVLMLSMAAVTYFTMPDAPKRTPGHINWLASVLLSSWLVALLLAVSKAPVWGWLSAPVLGLIALAVVLLPTWIVTEMRSRDPLIDIAMLRLPAVWTTNLAALLFGAGLYSMLGFLPQFLQTPTSTGYGFGLSITISGLIAVPMTVANFVFGAASGPLSNRFGARAVLLAGLVIGIAPYALMAYAHGSLVTISIAMVAQGISLGLAFSALSAIIVVAVPLHQTGAASGMTANIRTIGGSIGAAVVASIITAHPQAGGWPRESGYTNGFAVLGGLAVLGALAGLAVPRLRSDTGSRHRVKVVPAELAVVELPTRVGSDD